MKTEQRAHLIGLKSAFLSERWRTRRRIRTIGRTRLMGGRAALVTPAVNGIQINLKGRIFGSVQGLDDGCVCVGVHIYCIYACC